MTIFESITKLGSSKSVSKSANFHSGNDDGIDFGDNSMAQWNSGGGGMGGGGMGMGGGGMGGGGGGGRRGPIIIIINNNRRRRW